MRKTVLTASMAVAVMATSASAVDVALGVVGGVGSYSVKSTVTPDNGKKDVSKDQISGFYLAPTLLLKTSDKVTLAPYLGIGSSSYRTLETDTTTGAETNYKYSLLRFGAGFGVEFNMIRADWFELSAGPRINWQVTGKPNRTSDEVGFTAAEYDKYSNQTFGIDAPLDFDFFVGKSFGIRVGTELLDLTVNSKTSKVKESVTEYKNVTTSFSILGQSTNDQYDRSIDYIPLTLGVFFRF